MCLADGEARLRRASAEARRSTETLRIRQIVLVRGQSIILRRTGTIMKRKKKEKKKLRVWRVISQISRFGIRGASRTEPE